MTAGLLRGASVAGFLKALAAVLTFGLTVVLGRMLGAEPAGVYFLALTTVSVAALIGRVGLDNAVLRLVAANAAAGNWADVAKGYRTTLAIGLICSCLIAGALYVGSGFLADTVFSDAELAPALQMMAIAVVPLSLSVLVSKALLGLSRVRDSILVLSVLPTGIALGATWILASRWGVNGAIAAYAIALSLALAYGWLVWRGALVERSAVAGGRNAVTPTRQLLKSGMPLLVGDVLYLVMQAAGTLMLGIWASNVDVSQYAVAWRTAMLVSFAPLAVSTIVQPKFAQLYARGDMESLAKTTYNAVLLMVACSAPVLIVLLAAPELVMGVFGGDFSSGAATLQILAVSQFINIAMGSVGMLLVMSGQERQFRNILIASAVVVVALNAVLIPAYGAVGAAISVTVAHVVQNVLFAYVGWVKFGILMISPRLRIPRSVGDA